MTKDEALDVLKMAAENWANELSEYIIPSSEEAEDGCTDGYNSQYDAIHQALEVLA